MFSSSHLLELFVVLCAADGYIYVISTAKSALVYARARSGPMRPDSVPTHLLVGPFSALQAVACFSIPIVYTLAVVGYGFQQPQWMDVFALPDVAWKSVPRVLACLAGFPVRKMIGSVFDHLGDQYHPIGRREKSRIVQTGPYAWVRHPFYTFALSQMALQALMFWSYVPLFGLLTMMAILLVKIPIEEAAIQGDTEMREEYRSYMCKVPARLVPFIW